MLFRACYVSLRTEQPRLPPRESVPLPAPCVPLYDPDPLQESLQAVLRLLIARVKRRDPPAVEYHLIKPGHLCLLDELVPKREQQEEWLSKLPSVKIP